MIYIKIKEAGEMYLETILVLSHKLGQVRAIDIVHEMNYSKPTVSIVMRDFRKDGYIIVDENGHITLTEKGKIIAERVYERHEFLSKMLMKIGVSEEAAYADACKIEHDLSDETFTCFKKYFEDKM